MRGAFTLWLLILLMSFTSPLGAGVMAGMKGGVSGMLAGFVAGVGIGAAGCGFWYTAGRRAGVYIQKHLAAERQEFAFAALYIAAFISTILTSILAMDIAWHFAPR